MLLVLPVSRADAHLFPFVEKAFARFAPGVGHDLLCVGSENAADEVKAISASLCRYFANTSSYILAADSDLGWPMACNYYFQQTCYHIDKLGIRCWMWFELDCTPISAGWLNIIASEYLMQGKPFMGAKEKTIRGFNGALSEDSGDHMVAVGVYPGDIIHRIVSIPGVSATMLPWWEFLQWQIVPHMAETKLIQENWRTLRYRKENGAIVCDSDANLAWRVDYNRVILGDTVVVHGNKDGTLIDLYDHGNLIATPALSTIEKPRPVPKSRKMSKSARQSRVARYQAQLVKDNG